MARMAVMVLFLGAFIPMILKAEEVLKVGEIDSSTVEVGAYVVIIYGEGEKHPVSGKWERMATVRGYIKAIDSERLTIGIHSWKTEIERDQIHKLVIAMSERERTGKLRSMRARYRPNLTLEADYLGGVDKANTGYFIFGERHQKALPWSASVYFGDFFSSERRSRIGLIYAYRKVHIFPESPDREHVNPYPPKEKRMKKLAVVFVIATLLLNAMALTLAHAATYLQGIEVNADTLIQDAYVAVTYYDSKNKQTLDKGWIDAIDETTFTIRNGLWGKKTIAYTKILSLVMSEEATTIGQINEVNRWFIGNIAERGTEMEQAAIQRLNQKTVTIMSRGQIAPSEIPKGWYAHIVYSSQRATETGRIADKDSSSIALKYGFDTHNITAYDDIDTLIVAKHLREIERYRETGAKYNARVRVYAPSIQKGQMVGKLIKMMQDTLVIQKGRSFYQVPVSSISTFDVSTKQYRNTGKGFKIGLVAGAVIIGFTIISTHREEKRLDEKNSGDASLAYYTLGIATLVGYSAGALVCLLSTLIGATIKSDKWVGVPPDRLNLSIAPTASKGLSAALTFNF